MAALSMHRVPASLQAYLESDVETSGPTEESEATPKLEKTKEQSEVKTEPPKIEIPEASSLDLDKTSPVNRPVIAETTKNARTRSSSRVTKTPAPDHEALKGPRHTSPKRSSPSTSSLEAGPPPVPNYIYANTFPGPPAFQSPQLTYLTIPPMADPSVSQHALVPPGMMYYPEYSPQFTPPNPQQQLQHVAPHNSNVGREDSATLLHRVQCALPDIHTLVDSYQDVYSLLESREAQINHMEAQRATEMQQQAMRFAQLESELESMVHQHAAECHRLKLTASEIEKRYNHLKDKMVAESKLRESLQAAYDALQGEKRRMEKKHEEGKAALVRKFSAEKDSLLAEHRERHKSLHEQLQAQLQVHSQKTEAHLSLRIAECNRANEREKQELEIAWTKRRRELEDKHEKVICGLEDTIEAKQRIVDEERRTYLHAREGWDKERNMTARRWEEERAILRKTSEEQHKFLVTKHERETNDILKQISHTQHKSDTDEIILKQQREIEALRAGWEADKFRFQQKASDFRSTAKTLNEQHSKLQKVMEAFGDINDGKGK